LDGSFEERVMKILAISACALVLLTGVAHAQGPAAPGENTNTEAARQDAEASRARLEQKRQRELDAAYKAASAKTKAPTTPVDPWGGVRPANGSSAATK
jgi:hypothetical protein